MRWITFLMIVLLLRTSAAADLPASQLEVSLEGASIREMITLETRKVTVQFGDRMVISEERIDHFNETPMETLFGRSGDVSPLFSEDGIIQQNFNKRLTEPTWTIDGAGEGTYLPAQPELEARVASDPWAFALHHSASTGRRQSLRMTFGKVSREEMGQIASSMENPVLAPLRITENDPAALIVYDLSSRTTAYILTSPNERMNSAGYLCGVSQPGMVLVRSTARGLEISSATKTRVTVRLKLVGDWEKDINEENVLLCERKAGRTWIEFSASEKGSPPIHLIKLPDRSFFGRLLDLF